MDQRTLPKVLSRCPEIASLGEPHSNKGSTDSQSTKKANSTAKEDLSNEFTLQYTVDEQCKGETETNLNPHLAEQLALLLGTLDNNNTRPLLERVVITAALSRLFLLGFMVMQVRALYGFVVHDLLDKTKEDRDDNGRLNGLTEDDEEDWYGEKVLGHREA